MCGICGFNWQDGDLAREMVAAMKRSGLEVAYCNLESDQGHDAFLLPGNRLGAVVKGYLERLSMGERP